MLTVYYACAVCITIVVYAVHLLDIQFGKLVCDINWWVFSLVTRAIQITYGYVPV